MVGLAQECGLALPTGGEARDFWQLPSDNLPLLDERDSDTDPLLRDEALLVRFTKH